MSNARAVTVAVVLGLALPSTAAAQLKVIVSGGFAGAYQQVVPEFERTTGMTLTTQSGASQGTGPDTIGAQLRRGIAADVVILSREGLDDLIAEGRILRGSDVDLAQTPTGLAVRAGVSKPDISTIEAFQRALLGAKTIAVPGSTTGIYLTKQIFPKLGVNGTAVRVTARGAESAAMVAKGDAEFAIQPVSELVHAAGVDLVGPIPREVQYVSVFSAAVVAGSSNTDAAKRLISALASENALAALRNNGMEPVKQK